MQGAADEIMSAVAAFPSPRSVSEWPVRVLWIAALATAATLALALWGVIRSS